MFALNSVYKFCKCYTILAISLDMDLVSIVKFSLNLVSSSYLMIKEVFLAC